MGLYAKYVLPCLIEVGMRNPEMARLRAEWVSRAVGHVLEIGIGSGLNLPFYSSQVDSVQGVDPSSDLLRIARKRTAGTRFAVEFLQQSGEAAIPVADLSIDTVVVTWTLCSLKNPVVVLRNVRRMLKPDGCVIFVEHGRALEPAVSKWQDRITPLWKRIAGGCTVNRRVDEIVWSAGFKITELNTGYMLGPRVMGFMYKGIAKLS